MGEAAFLWVSGWAPGGCCPVTQEMRELQRLLCALLSLFLMSCANLHSQSTGGVDVYAFRTNPLEEFMCIYTYIFRTNESSGGADLYISRANPMEQLTCISIHWMSCRVYLQNQSIGGVHVYTRACIYSFTGTCTCIYNIPMRQD